MTATNGAHPKGLIRVDGKLVVRRVFLEPDPSAPILCRNDHEITHAGEIFEGTGAYQCRAVLTSGPSPRRGVGEAGGTTPICGAIVGVVEGAGVVSVRFDLTAEERSEIKHRRMRTAEILDFLGLTL